METWNHEDQDGDSDDSVICLTKTSPSKQMEALNKLIQEQMVEDVDDVSKFLFQPKAPHKPQKNEAAPIVMTEEDAEEVFRRYIIIKLSNL